LLFFRWEKEGFFFGTKSLSLIKKHQKCVPMAKLVSYTIIVNVILGLFYLYSSIMALIWVTGWSSIGYTPKWSPFFITLHRSSTISPVQPYTPSLLNTPFLLFWVILAANLYFIIRLQKSRETKQTPFLEFEIL
jgi:hypothetical protein